MGDRPAPSTQESTADILKALTNNLPSLVSAYDQQAAPIANTELAVAQGVSPAYAELLNNLYKSYGPSLAQTGTQVENINRTGAAQTDLDILRGSGGDLAREAVKIDKELNPEYYATRQAEAGKLGDLLSSINLNNPNPEAERLVNQENIRSGTLNTPSTTNTVSNAISFGNEAQKRRDALTTALNAATNFLAPSQGQFNPVVTALNRPSTNAGANQFAGVQNPTLGSSANIGSNFLGNISSLKGQENQINANRRDALDRVTQVMGSISV